MLEIVNPGLVSVDAIKNRSGRGREIHDCDYCGHTHGKGECPAFVKLCNRCGRKTHIEKKCRQNRPGGHKGKSTRFGKKNSKCTHRCDVHGIYKEDCHEDDRNMEDLMDQVQSLLSVHWNHSIDGCWAMVLRLLLNWKLKLIYLQE